MCPVELDLGTAERLVRAAGVGHDPSGIVPIGDGVKGRVWRVDFASCEPLALKVYSRDGAVMREHAAYRACAGLELALPQMVGGELTADGASHGWTLMTLSPGHPMNLSLPALPRERLLEIYVDVGRQLRRLHDVRCPSFSLVVGAENGERSSPEWFRARAAASIEGFLAHGGNRYLASRIDRRFLEFEGALASCKEPRFCHGDMHPENIRIEPAGAEGAFVGSLDLEESFAADPAQDLVRTLHTCPSPGDDVREALLIGYGDPPPWLDDVFDAYFLYYELELWNFFAAGGSRRPLASIARRLARQSDASRTRIARSRVRRLISRPT